MMLAAVMTPFSWRSMRMVRCCSLEFLTTRLLTLRMMSVTSSTTPGIVLISCCTPWIFTRVTALPSKLESKMRLRLLPTVTPKPRSNGSAVNLPYVSVNPVRSLITRLGSSKPRHRIRIDHNPPIGERKNEATACFPGSGSLDIGLKSGDFDNQLFADFLDVWIHVGPAGQAAYPPFRWLHAGAFQVIRDRRRAFLKSEFRQL